MGAEVAEPIGGFVFAVEPETAEKELMHTVFTRPSSRK
jgi:hypothetical protein